MTQPPNGWGNQPLPPPPENGWQGQQPGQQPPVQSPPSWGPQYQQQFTPPPPPKNNRALKWALGGTALVAVVAITAVVTMSLGGSDKENGGDTGPTNTAGSGSNSEFASANDTGPVTIITEDPSCAAWAPIQSTLADASHQGWSDRDPSIPASVWSPDQRAQYQAVGHAMRSAADQTEPLVKVTPHRVMRQLFEQFIAYARAYADAIPTYTPPDDAFALTANTITGAVDSVCAAIGYGAASARSPLVPAGAPPTAVTPVADATHPTRFMTSPDPICPDWKDSLDQFASQTAAWSEMKSDIPASQWSPEEKAITDAVQPVMRESADKLEQLGQRSENRTLQDFAVLAAQYRRAYAQAIPTYRPADKYLAATALRATGVILGACKAPEA